MRTSSRKFTFLSLILLVGIWAQWLAPGCTEAQPTDDRPLLMVHYMPWYQAKPTRDYWGWHWTMNHFNPDEADSTGRRAIASHFYPLTGPYDSNDEDILEYQVLLMKISGIDGIIADWFGLEEFFDYALIDESTHHIARYAAKAGLRFAISYEDQSIKHMVDNEHLAADQALEHGREVMRYMQREWFAEEAYLKLDGRPVLLTFGPQFFFQSSAWDSLFAALPAAPHFFTLDNRLSPVATGAFPWPPMWKSVDGVLSDAALGEFLDGFYGQSGAWDYALGGAFPGFDDIYAQAGLGFSYGFLSADGGQTFAATLRQALENQVDIVQLITWNDFGEGTNIEPTVEYGYRYLEEVQRARQAFIEPDFAHAPDDLSLPLEIYQLRQAHPDDESVNAQLDRAFELVVAGDIGAARALVASLQAPTHIELEKSAPSGYRLEQNYPNPFNPQTTIFYRLGQAERVDLAVYNAAGQLVQRLVKGPQAAGQHAVIWDSAGLVSGLYFYKITAGEYSAVKKCMILQ